jgi:hypothetical protein
MQEDQTIPEDPQEGVQPDPAEPTPESVPASEPAPSSSEDGESEGPKD